MGSNDSKFEDRQLQINQQYGEKYHQLDSKLQSSLREQSQFNTAISGRVSGLEHNFNDFRRGQEAFNQQSVERFHGLQRDFLIGKLEQDHVNKDTAGRLTGIQRELHSFRQGQEEFNQNTARLYNEFQQQYKLDWTKQSEFNEDATNRFRLLDERTSGLEQANKLLRDDLGFLANRTEKHFDVMRAFNEQTDRHLRSLDGRNEELWRRLEDQKKYFTIAGLLVLAWYIYNKQTVWKLKISSN